MPVSSMRQFKGTAPSPPLFWKSGLRGRIRLVLGRWWAQTRSNRIRFNHCRCSQVKKVFVKWHVPLKLVSATFSPYTTASLGKSCPSLTHLARGPWRTKPSPSSEHTGSGPSAAGPPHHESSWCSWRFPARGVWFSVVSHSLFPSPASSSGGRFPKFPPTISISQCWGCAGLGP